MVTHGKDSASETIYIQIDVILELKQ